MDNIFIDKQTNVVFTPDSNGVFYPRYMNFDEKTGNAKIISKIPIYRELFELTSYLRRQTDKKTGKKKSLPLFPYQWGAIIDVVEALLNPQSQQFLLAFSRQSGKSTILEILTPFALTVLPKYVDVDIERFTVILGSYKDDAVDELYKKIKPNILKAIEFYNKRNKSQLICKAIDSTVKLMDNKNLLEIDKVFPNGEQIAYSQIRNITCGAVSDGYTASLLVVDESGLINADLFKTSMANFTSATAGISVFSGVPCSNSASLFYAKRRSKTVKTLLYDFPLVRDGKYMVSKKLGDHYVADYNQKVNETSGGERSSFIRWNYYLDTEDSSGKFISRQKLDDNNVLVNSIKTPQKDKDIYIVAGIDVSASGDYKVMTVGETRMYDDYDSSIQKITKKYISNVCDIIAFNKDGKQQSGEEFARMSAEVCKKYKIDCVAIDSSSAGGQIFTQLFRKHLAILGCKVMILPFSYNKNKQYLFGSLENSIYSGTIKLLKEHESWESEKLIEEMLYMLKEHKSNTNYVQYRAPQGSGFTDDLMNSLALFNLCLKEIYERSMDKRRCKAEDGSGAVWRIRLSRYSDDKVQYSMPNFNNMKKISSIWDMPY